MIAIWKQSCSAIPLCTPLGKANQRGIGRGRDCSVDQSLPTHSSSWSWFFFFFSSSWEEGQRVNSNVSIGSTGSWPYYMCCWGWLPWWAKEDGGFQNIVGWGVGGKRVWREQVLLMPGTCTFGGLLDRGGWEKSAGGCRLQDLGKERGQLRAWLLQLCNVICFYLCGLPVVMLFELLLQLKLWFPWVCSLGSPAIENFCLKNPPADGWDSSVPSSVCNELDK